MTESFPQLAEQLEAVIAAALPRLRAQADADMARPRAPGKWSRKEVLGHLLDSEANNRQRFVRGQAVPKLTIPGYDQDDWVRAHGYAERPWDELVELWAANNRNLAEVIRRIPASAADVPVRIGEHDPVTLQFLAADYVRHLRHHLEQLDEGLGA